jgi:hypothetical protein
MPKTRWTGSNVYTLEHKFVCLFRYPSSRLTTKVSRFYSLQYLSISHDRWTQVLSEMNGQLHLLVQVQPPIILDDTIKFQQLSKHVHFIEMPVSC